MSNILKIDNNGISKKKAAAAAETAPIKPAAPETPTADGTSYRDFLARHKRLSQEIARREEYKKR